MTTATPKQRRPRPWFSSEPKPRWPPYHIVEDSIEGQAKRRMERLERLYHKGQTYAWDGREVLAGLIEKHGPPHIPEDKKESALYLMSVLMWGELAAWAISADSAERIDDVEAKMAATSQAHDEARHFYVMRDYMHAVGAPIPRLPGMGRRLLIGILETDSMVHKLVGMQLLVESNALAIFKAIREADIEPVLTELLPYYERDEARHVGLGVTYLPKLLEKLSRVEALGVTAFQLRCVLMLLTAGLPMREHLRNLGINPRSMAARTVKLQDEIMTDMLEAARQNGYDGVRGLGGLMKPGGGIGPKFLDFVHPPNGLEGAAPLHRAFLRTATRGAKWVNDALA